MKRYEGGFIDDELTDLVINSDVRVDGDDWVEMVYCDWKLNPRDVVEELETLFTHEKYLDGTHEIVELTDGTDSYRFLLIKKEVLG